MKSLTEERSVMSRRELKLKQQLKNLLLDDGEGHHHALYAKRLEDFDIHIVYRDPKDPETLMFTAACDMENGIIYIGQGFLSDPGTFYQLNVLIRHEMAHALMRHQIRMMHEIVSKYGEKGYTHIKMSSSLHELENIIADFEISNERYTTDDKETVRHMMLNGELIGGLITEDHRADWQNLKIGDMYARLTAEINDLHKQVLQEWTNSGEDEETRSISLSADALKNDKNEPDFIKRHIASLYQANKNNLSELGDDITKFIESTAFKRLPDEIRSIIQNLEKEFNTANYTVADLDKVLTTIVTSNPTETLDIINPNTGEVIETVYTPEEKSLASEVIKSIKQGKDLYKRWYNTIIKVIPTAKLDSGTITQDEIKQLYDALNQD